MAALALADPRARPALPDRSPPMPVIDHDGQHLLRRFALATLAVAGLLLLAVGDGQPWPLRLTAVGPCALRLPFLCLGFWWSAAVTPVADNPARRLWLTHGGGALAGSALWYVLSTSVASWLGPAGPAAAELLVAQRAWLLLLGLVAYLVVLQTHTLLAAQAAGAEASLRREESLRQAREAELAALRLQIHPHFLFNALHSISALTALDAGRARDMTVRLAEFLRRNLALGEQPDVSLAEELELIDDYLALQQLRFGERLVVARQVPDDLAAARVPPLLLQPLVENALKHGLASLTGPMTLVLSGAREGDELVLAVGNEHDPTAAAEPRGAGLGLANTAGRLATLRGDEDGLTVRDEAGRFEVTLRLPWTTRPSRPARSRRSDP